jgi:hypothetical protein
VRHVRLDIEKSDLESFFNENGPQGDKFHHSLFPGLRCLTLDIDAKLVVWPQSDSESDSSTGNGSSSDEDEAELAAEEAAYAAAYHEFDQEYHLAECLLRPRNLREVRLVIHANSDSPDFELLDVVHLADHIRRMIMEVRRSRAPVRLRFEIIVRRSTGIDTGPRNLFVAAMSQYLLRRPHLVFP